MNGLHLRRICATLLMLLTGIVTASVLHAAPLETSKKSNSNRRDIDLRAELTGRDTRKMNDDQLYTEILSQYQRGDSMAMKQTLGLLLKKFKNSPHADNALYLVGYNALEKNRYAESLQYFQQLLRDYPASNKAVSAEYSKGVAYRRMNLSALAQKSFFKVRKKYPGSPESFRAENELKLLVRK